METLPLPAERVKEGILDPWGLLMRICRTNRNDSTAAQQTERSCPGFYRETEPIGCRHTHTHTEIWRKKEREWGDLVCTVGDRGGGWQDQNVQGRPAGWRCEGESTVEVEDCLEAELPPLKALHRLLSPSTGGTKPPLGRIVRFTQSLLTCVKIF